MAVKRWIVRRKICTVTIPCCGLAIFQILLLNDLLGQNPKMIRLLLIGHYHLNETLFLRVWHLVPDSLRLKILFGSALALLFGPRFQDRKVSIVITLEALFIFVWARVYLVGSFAAQTPICSGLPSKLFKVSVIRDRTLGL